MVSVAAFPRRDCSFVTTAPGSGSLAVLRVPGSTASLVTLLILEVFAFFLLFGWVAPPPPPPPDPPLVVLGGRLSPVGAGWGFAHPGLT